MPRVRPLSGILQCGVLFDRAQQKMVQAKQIRGHHDHSAFDGDGYDSLGVVFPSAGVTMSLGLFGG